MHYEVKEVYISLLLIFVHINDNIYTETVLLQKTSPAVVFVQAAYYNTYFYY